MKTQQGATLIISLIILLVLALISVAGIRAVVLEERMVGNQRDVQLAFQAAEAALEHAEQTVKSFSTTPLASDYDWLYNRQDATPLWQQVNWQDPDAVADYGGPALGQLSQQPKHVAELLMTVSANDSLEVGAVDDSQQLYRITTRATGQSDNAVVIIQSIYRQ
ncbi:pilus assembly PilX family protein [Salinibius halmophilus]|uniref:pilus assembly PilX family protein n=1 Tax=Salinibius halmophilus TaxID=1853216 RepID=UPI000E661828|nr:pilus assembly protein [Salinibius halmophilus]